MSLRKKAHRDAEVSTDSLSDIMFCLMLFFLILFNFLEAQIIYPKAKDKQRIEPRIKNIILIRNVSSGKKCKK